jgi:membrane associated rhomboid family serine protease
VRYNIQIWRAPISFFFHSNIAHFILNLIGVQIYGYFVEWYYGKAKYVITLLVAGLMGFVLSCVTQPTTVSTCASSLLFAIFALKLYFLY